MLNAHHHRESCPGGMGVVFDKFKSWRDSQKRGTVCPSCQHQNQEGIKVCVRCYYQLDKPAFQQGNLLEEKESTDLLDELVSEIQEEGEEDYVPASFAMDDVTIEVEQYGDGEQIVLNNNPDLKSIIAPLEVEEEEDYQLSSADIPEFVKKFEVPVPEEEEEDLGRRRVELIQPNAETPDVVATVPASEVPDSPVWLGSDEGENKPLLADFDGDGRVDEIEAAFAVDSKAWKKDTEVPQAPSVPIPRLSAEPVHEETLENREIEEQITVPRAPSLDIAHPEISEESIFPGSNTYWPWQQQEEWPATEIIKQLQAAIRAAKEQNPAQATVLLDEVGPHLGDRNSLIYSVGRLMMSIGRSNEAKKMVESAYEKYPNDPDVLKSRQKLIS